ncbi:MAG: hypothetical protein QOD88_3186, partial [Mycobacterium sp.]|nr:hypothetical protein [Mycobacterium sp.]
GRYRIAIGDQILDAPPGTRATVPRNTPHSWRNIAAEEGRLLAILTPGGFEQIIYAVKDTPPEKIRDLADRFGCDILGPPVAECSGRQAPFTLVETAADMPTTLRTKLPRE